MDEFSAALQNLKTFNRMIASHAELSSRVLEGDEEYLQWRQAKIFIAFREQHRAKAARDAASGPRKGFGRSLAAFFKRASSGLGATALTFWAMWGRGKKEALIFSVDKISAEGDHDFRIDGLYRFLKERGISFTETFHTQLGKSTFVHAKRRGRAAVYREAFEFLGAIWLRWCPCRAEARLLSRDLPCTEFQEADRPFVRGLVEKLLFGVAASRFEIAWYRRVLKAIRPKMVLAIDDTRYYQELCAAARAEHIPFYAFQHGHFTKYHAGWLASGVGRGRDTRPDALYLWSPYWKKELLRLGTNFFADELRIGGNPKNDAKPSMLAPYVPPTDAETIGLLVPFETDAPFEEVQALLRRLLATGRVKIWLKTRPDWDTETQMRLYGLHDRPSEEVEAVSQHAPILERIHAVAGIYSTFLYDALASMKPVFIFKTSMDFGEGMSINGLADAFDTSGEDAIKRLRALCRDAAPKLAERLERYQGGTGDVQATLATLFEEA